MKTTSSLKLDEQEKTRKTVGQMILLMDGSKVMEALLQRERKHFPQPPCVTECFSSPFCKVDRRTDSCGSIFVFQKQTNKHNKTNKSNLCFLRIVPSSLGQLGTIKTTQHVAACACNKVAQRNHEFPW